MVIIYHNFTAINFVIYLLLVNLFFYVNDIFILRAIIKSYLILDGSLCIINKNIFYFIKLFKISTSHILYLILIVLHQISHIHEWIRHISPTL